VDHRDDRSFRSDFMDGLTIAGCMAHGHGSLGLIRRVPSRHASPAHHVGKCTPRAADVAGREKAGEPRPDSPASPHIQIDV
jgi:hypothetical protein